jgi:hypothetical protein
MADNAVPFATDDISGVFYPRVKITVGPDGTNDGDVSQANPIPVQSGLRTDVIFVGSVSALPIMILLSASSSSTITLQAAQTSAKMRVLSYVLNAKATTSVDFRSSTTPLTGMMEFDKYGGVVAPFNPLGHFTTAVGQPLIVTTGAGAIAGHITIVPVSV